MKTRQLMTAGVAALALLTYTCSSAEETTKPTAASKQASKARSHANQDNEGSADTTSGATSSTAGQKDSDNTHLLDTSTMDKTARDTNDALKKMDKVLDGF